MWIFNNKPIGKLLRWLIPQLNGNIGATYNPNVAVQVFPNFIAAGTYGVLAQEGVKDG